jgi:hypothetical protein
MRVSTKIGDVFSVKIDEKTKKYFQLIAFDLTQLNSDVIRGFKRTYAIGDTPDLAEVINDEVVFYAHFVTKIGVKMKIWEKVGNVNDVGKLDDILFRGSNDYGSKPGQNFVSENWYVWKINDERFTKVGKLTGAYQNAFIGIVFDPLSIVELFKGSKCPLYYPDF